MKKRTHIPRILSVLTTIIFSTHTITYAEMKTPEHTMTLKENWNLISSEAVIDVGELHHLDWDSPKSHQISVPNTVFGALVEDGTFPDPFFGEKLKEYDKSLYQKNWFYRTTFDLNKDVPSGYTELILEGFNFRANVWLNGHQIGNQDELVGPFRIYKLDVSEVVQENDNVLVIEIIRPMPDDLTIGWVDWNPYPPDDNIGLWRPVKIRQTGKVSLDDVFVQTELNKETLDEAEIIVTGKLVNHSNSAQKVNLTGMIAGVEVNYKGELKAKESKTIRFDSTNFPRLKVENPKIWWPHHLGDQPLHDFTAEVSVDNSVSDRQNVRFGIREVEDYINEQGHRGWMVNGKKVLIRGGGWVDDLFLREDPERVRNQVLLTKHMNLNTIRLEGFWGSSKELFDACDEEGVLLMIGWSCHWEWENYCHRPTDNYLLIKTPEDIAFQAQSFREQVEWLRNHPSIFTWVFGSDMLPRPELELALYEHLDEVDPTRPRLVGCRQKSQDGNEDYTSEISGPVAVKMVGPYSYVTPNYWYEDKIYGGAFGFNTETGPGLQPTVLESVKRFTPEKDLWPLNDTWAFHTGRSVFASFEFWLPAFNSRYGEADSAADFCYRAQMSNYEAIRSMFEAFAVNKPEATGVIQWMLNSAFPNHLWQLYDYYLMPTGAFYGTMKACQSLNAAYDYANHSVHITNELLDGFEGLTVEAEVLDTNSKRIWVKTEKLSVDAESSQLWTKLPEIKKLDEPTYFLDIKIKDAEGKELASNFYWLSTEEDVCEYEKSNWHITPNSDYADFTATQHLPESTVSGNWRQLDEKSFEVQLTNETNKIAFFVELALVDEKTGQTILPVMWDDNYLSILPNGEKTIKVSFPHQNFNSDELVLRVKGMNISEKNIPLN